MNDDGFISTSKLAKDLGMPIGHVFDQLRQMGLIEKVGDKTELTEEGKRRGGRYMSSQKFGTWIAWPKDIIKVESVVPGVEAKPFAEAVKEHQQTATTLGRTFGIPATRMNYILSELGWIQKSLKGWKITPNGAAAGGIQREDTRSGIPYVAWPAEIAKHPALRATIDDLQGTVAPPTAEQVAAQPHTTATNQQETQETGFRNRFPATHRATDGHIVRSRAEVIIDNWLYMAALAHAYERKLPITEEVYCDFYLPEGKVYLEFWGMENDPKYADRMHQKKTIYAKYGFNLIDLTDADVQNLDDILPARLLKFGVQAY